MSKGPDETKLFIGNISYNTRDRDLEDLFLKYGKVKECRCAVDTQTGRNKGFGFVTMDDPADAAEAVKNTDGIELLGRTIRVEVSTGVRGSGGGGRRDNRDDRDRNDRSYGRDRDERYSDRSYGRDRRDDDRRDDRSYGRSDRDGRRDDDRSYGRDRDSRPSYREDKDDRRDSRERRDRSRDRDGY